MTTCPWTYMQGGHRFGPAVLSQTWSGLYWLSRLFWEVPRLRSCVELGTASGGLSSLFGLSFPGSTRTVDLDDYRGPQVRALHGRLGVEFMALDLLQPGACERALEGMPRPMFLFCDNGNKEQEFKTCRPLLRSGDVVAVHDYGTEFLPGRVAGSLSGLTPWRTAELSADTTYLGVWEVP